MIRSSKRVRTRAALPWKNVTVVGAGLNRRNGVRSAGNKSSFVHADGHTKRVGLVRFRGIQLKLDVKAGSCQAIGIAMQNDCSRPALMPLLDSTGSHSPMRFLWLQII